MIEKGIGFQTLHESKTQEEKENEELNLFNALNPGDPGLSIGRLPLQLLPLLDKPKIGPRGATAPHTYDERTVTLSKTQQSNRFQHDGWQNWSEGKSMSKGGSERVSVCVCVSQISCMSSGGGWLGSPGPGATATSTTIPQVQLQLGDQVLFGRRLHGSAAARHPALAPPGLAAAKAQTHTHPNQNPEYLTQTSVEPCVPAVDTIWTHVIATDPAGLLFLLWTYPPPPLL